MLGLASVAGQIVGGLLLVWNPFDLGWRVVFLVNVPIGLATLVLGARLIPESRRDEPRPIDPIGIALLSAGVLAVVYPLGARARGGLGAVGVGHVRCRGVAAPGLFVAVERSRTRAGRATLLDLDVFARHDFRLGSGQHLLPPMLRGVDVPVLTVHLQDGLGFSPIESGLTYLPLGMAFALASLFVRRAGAPRPGHRHTARHVGLAVADALLALAVSRTGEWSAIWAVPLLVLLGGGPGRGLHVDRDARAVTRRASPRGQRVRAARHDGAVGKPHRCRHVRLAVLRRARWIDEADRGRVSNTALSVTLAVAAPVAFVRGGGCFTRLDTSPRSPGSATPRSS